MQLGGAASRRAWVEMPSALCRKWVTQWHQIIAWGKKAELIEKFVKKGQLLAVDGKLVNRIYQDNGGGNRRVTEIQVNEILLINPKKAG